MLIGILQTGHFVEEAQDRLGNYDTMFPKLLAGRGLEFKSWPVVDMVFPDSVEECDGWLITGSKHGAYEDLEFIPPLEDFIRKAHESGVPMVGICFGHQIIAQALGGKVEKFSGGWSVGHQVYQIEGQPKRLIAYHQDQVTEVPDGAEVIGSSDFCANAALVYPGWAWTVQPHPEYDSEVVEALFEYRAPGRVPSELVTRARADLALPIDSPSVADRIAAFFKENAK
jgi:GMP synthase (glutamine-hydrolysing)